MRCRRSRSRCRPAGRGRGPRPAVLRRFSCRSDLDAESTGRPLTLPACPQAAQPLDQHRVGRERGRGVDQGVRAPGSSASWTCRTARGWPVPSRRRTSTTAVRRRGSRGRGGSGRRRDAVGVVSTVAVCCGSVSEIHASCSLDSLDRPGWSGDLTPNCTGVIRCASFNHGRRRQGAAARCGRRAPRRPHASPQPGSRAGTPGGAPCPSCPDPALSAAAARDRRRVARAGRLAAGAVSVRITVAAATARWESRGARAQFREPGTATPRSRLRPPPPAWTTAADRCCGRSRPHSRRRRDERRVTVTGGIDGIRLDLDDARGRAAVLSRAAAAVEDARARLAAPVARLPHRRIRCRRPRGPGRPPNSPARRSPARPARSRPRPGTRARWHRWATSAPHGCPTSMLDRTASVRLGPALGRRPGRWRRRPAGPVTIPSADARAVRRRCRALADARDLGPSGRSTGPSPPRSSATAVPSVHDLGLDGRPQAVSPPRTLADLVAGLALRNGGRHGEMSTSDPHRRRRPAPRDRRHARHQVVEPGAERRRHERGHQHLRALAGARHRATRRACSTRWTPAGRAARRRRDARRAQRGRHGRGDAARDACAVRPRSTSPTWSPPAPRSARSPRDLPERVQVLALENRADVVPHCDGAAEPGPSLERHDGHGRRDQRHGIGNNHDVGTTYERAAVSADASGDPSVDGRSWPARDGLLRCRRLGDPSRRTRTEITRRGLSRPTLAAGPPRRPTICPCTD